MADSGLPPLVERPYEQDNYAFPSPGRNFSHNVPRNGTPWPPMQATSFATTDASGFPTNSPGQWTQSPGFLMQPAFVAHPAVGWPGMTPGIGIIPPPLAPSASTPAQFTRENDEWVSIERDPEQERIREREHEDRTWGNWPRDRDALPIGFRDHPPRPRSQLSRAASTSRRPHSPFSSSNSSPLSRSGSFSNSRVRSRSFTRPVAEAEKRPPREWRPDFSMIRSSSLASALGSIFNSPKRTHTMSKRGESSLHFSLLLFVVFFSSLRSQSHPYECVIPF